MSTLAELMARQVNSPRIFKGRIVNRSVDANGDQICFGCGQSGHINRMCPNRASGPNRRQDARAVVQPPVQNDVRQYVPHRPQRADFIYLFIYRDNPQQVNEDFFQEDIRGKKR